MKARDISFEDRMATVLFDVAPAPHIFIDGDKCRGCSTKDCVTACPANLFIPLDDGSVVFNYELCFECGTCYMICNEQGAITWSYPPGGAGAAFRYG